MRGRQKAYLRGESKTYDRKCNCSGIIGSEGGTLGRGWGERKHGVASDQTIGRFWGDTNFSSNRSGSIELDEATGKKKGT